MKLNQIADRPGSRKKRVAHRPRHRLRHRQDRRPRRQGPDRALGRAHQGLRGRPDAAASAPAEARLQQAVPARSCTRSISTACSRRSTPASSTPARTVDAAALVKAGAAAPRPRRRAPARQGRTEGQGRVFGLGRLEIRGRRGRKGRRLGHDPGAQEGRGGRNGRLTPI